MSQAGTPKCDKYFKGEIQEAMGDNTGGPDLSLEERNYLVQKVLFQVRTKS